MNKEELALKLDSMEYGDPLAELDRIARDNNLVIVRGASDDLIEFDGAISDEFEFYGDETEVIINHKELMFKIKATMNKDDYFMFFDTEIPHATFNIFDVETKYCRGLVFSLDELEVKKEKTEAEKLQNILNFKIGSEPLYYDVKGLTVKEVFIKLLNTMFNEEDCFSGKRPFGNSGFYSVLEQAIYSEYPELVEKEVCEDDENDILFQIINQKEYNRVRRALIGSL